MKQTSRNPYDLTVGNVQDWRTRDLNKFTANRTRLWFQMRDRGQKARPSGTNIYERLCTWSNYLFWVLVFTGGVCLTFVVSNMIATIISGRLAQILGGH
jgi:hypothetical protein